MALSVLISAWITGLLSGGHCLAMCGGFLAAMSGAGMPPRALGEPMLPARKLASRQLPYNVGRLTTYAALGAIFGGAGAFTLAASDWLEVQRAFYVAANVFLLALAIAIVSKRAHAAWLQHVGAALFTRLLPVVRPLLLREGAPARFALGTIWGFVPCGLVYSVLPVALFAGGALEGAAVMLAFGLGTLPNLLAAGWIVARARAWLDSRVVRYGAGILLASFATVGIWRALQGPIARLNGPFCL